MKLKPILPYLASVIAMLAISCIYFMPAVFEGKVLFQGDTQQGIAIGQESKAFQQATGETSRWTNSLFGGMPTYQISPSYSNNAFITALTRLYSLYLPSPVSLVFIMMLGFFILLVTLRFKWYYALLGAIAWAFSSYFFIIIEAGHIWKFITLTYIPPTIAGVLLAYRGKYLLGGALAALFATFQVAANHPQMSYYFGMVLIAIAVASGVRCYQERRMKRFFAASAVLVFAAIVAFGANLPSLYHTYEYTQETIRGNNELQPQPSSTTPVTTASAGLDKEYITQWSYGVDETLTLLIPNAKGGVSAPVSQDKEAMQRVEPEFRQYMNMVTRYWGDQPFTAGPVYVGALVLFFFVLGCFVVKGPLKWALLACTLLSIALSWGKNMMWLTDFFIDYLPLYNKFRTVSSILVVAEFCIPFLALIALHYTVEHIEGVWRNKRPLVISFLLTAGVALLFAVAPQLYGGGFSSEYEQEIVRQNPDYLSLFQAVMPAREYLFVADAWRSFFIISLGVAGLVFFAMGKIKRPLFLSLIILLTLGDMFSVNKRYINDESFVTPQRLTNPFPKTPIDELILQDPALNYRVLNLTANTYNDPTTSYYHKSIGGYHAAKLGRYQALIEHQLSKNNWAVVDMLNGKYIIYPDANRAPQVQLNPSAAGNAWWIDRIKWVDDAAQEMQALDSLELKQGIIDRRFSPLLTGKSLGTSAPDDTIRLVTYQPNKLVYHTMKEEDGVALFSEIYYPHGWQATIDGNPVEILRANYVLRALPIPAGEHEVIFTFAPRSIPLTQTIAWICLGLICLLSLSALLWPWLSAKRKRS